MPSNPSERSGNERYTFLARYGATILRGGIAAIPTALYRYQGELKLAPQHVWFISAILARKWDADLPYPSLRKMAAETGVSEQQLHNYKRQLVEAGWLAIINRHNRLGGQDTNYYDFGPLFVQLERLLGRDRPPQSAEGALNPSWETPLNSSLVAPLNPGLDQFEEAVFLEPLEDSALSKAATPAVSQTPGESVSKFRKGSRRSDLAIAEAEAAASRQPPAPPERAVPEGQPVTPRRSNFRKALSQRATTQAGSPTSEAAQHDQTAVDDRMDQVYEALRRAGIEAHRAPASGESETSPVARDEFVPATTGDADPEYIDMIVRDISSELHDSKHTRSNVTQARRLWQASGMTVLEFKDTLYDIRRVVRLQSGVENRMAYYFKCLKVVLGMEQNPNPVRQGTDVVPPRTTDQPGERPSLAGRYAHLVRR
jgi:hypothetical protein